MKNKILIYKVDNITSLTDKIAYLSKDLFFSGELEFYFETDEDVVVENSKLISVNGQEIRYNKDNQILSLPGYMFFYQDGLLSAIYGSPDTYHFIYDGDQLIQVGDYKIRYYREGLVDGIFIIGDDKENEFIAKYKERLDKFQSIEEEAEEELEELEKIDHD